LDEKKPVLNTCNPGRMIAVSHSLSPQEVRETAEIIFTYDVKFTVSNCQVSFA
jgi:transmembrane 9 superfamily protein 2/4